MLKCAMIGLGGLGQVHLQNVLKLPEYLELVALCDIDLQRLQTGVSTNLGDSSGKTDLSQYRCYTDAEEMLKKEKPDLVITALPSYLHKKYAVMAMDYGAHVLSEKPMALSLEHCREMQAAAKRNGKKLMIGQCLRHKDCYLALKEFLENGKLGKLVRADFYRFSQLPIWGYENWFTDFEKSGGCAMDLHIHDVDMIQWLLGRPQSVSSVATHNRTEFDSISTRYTYADGLCVTARCDWSFTTGYTFRRGYTAIFEKGAVEMTDAGEVLVYPQDEDQYKAELSGRDPFLEELRDFVRCILENRDVTILNTDSTMQTVEIALAEIQSARIGQPVMLLA